MKNLSVGILAIMGLIIISLSGYSVGVETRTKSCIKEKGIYQSRIDSLGISNQLIEEEISILYRKNQSLLDSIYNLESNRDTVIIPIVHTDKFREKAIKYRKLSRLWVR